VRPSRDGLESRRDMKEKLVAVGSFLCPGLILCTLVLLLVLQSTVDMEAEIPPPLRIWVGVFMALQFLSVMGVWALIIYDLLHIVRNPRFTNQQRLVWILLLWVLNIFVIPIYWLKHLKK